MLTIEELENEVARRRAEIQALEGAIQTIRSILGNDAKPSLFRQQADQVLVPVSRPVDTQRVQQSSLLAFPENSVVATAQPAKAMKRADAIEELLRSENRPMTVSEIVSGLVSRGHSVPSEHRNAFNSIFGTLKHNEDRFVKVGRGQWWLRSMSAQ
jgi:hypothetical protein